MQNRSPARTQPVQTQTLTAVKGAERLLTYLVMGVALLWAAPSFGQTTTFTVPSGCEAYLTVQSADCTVDHHFICAADPDGHQRRVSLDEEGMAYLGMIDAETQWIQSFHAYSGHSERLEPAPADPASLSDLIATGRDDYDFRTLSDEVGVTRYVGYDELTGRDITIDGVTLPETRFAITATTPDGEVLWSSEGHEFISREWGMFIGGTSRITSPSGEYERDGRPVEFIFPGEEGFLSVNPKHGCGVVMSRLEVVK